MYLSIYFNIKLIMNTFKGGIDPVEQKRFHVKFDKR
jgi:hypothetical protein